MPFDFLKPKSNKANQSNSQPSQSQTVTRYPTDFLLGDLLLKAGMVTQQQLDEAVKLAGNKHMHVGQMLIMAGYLSPRDLQAAVDAQSMLRDKLIDPTLAARCLKIAKKTGYSFAEVVRDEDASAQGGTSNKLGELLLEAGLVAGDQLAKSMQRSMAIGLPLGRILVLNGALPDSILTLALELQVRIRDGMMTREEALDMLRSAGGSGTNEPVDVNETLQLKAMLAPPRRKGLRLGELMVLGGLLTETDVMNALEVGLVNEQPIGQALVAQGYVSEELLEAALELQKRVDENRLDPMVAGECLSKIRATGMGVSDVVENLEKQQEDQPKPLLSFDRLLIMARVVTEDDIESALDESAKSAQILGKVLHMTGYIDEMTMQAVLQCYTMLSNGFLTQDDAVVTLDYCLHKSPDRRVTFAEALSELGWNAMLPMQVQGSTSVDISEIHLGLSAEEDEENLGPGLLDELAAEPVAEFSEFEELSELSELEPQASTEASSDETAATEVAPETTAKTEIEGDDSGIKVSSGLPPSLVVEEEAEELSVLAEAASTQPEGGLASMLDDLTDTAEPASDSGELEKNDLSTVLEQIAEVEAADDKTPPGANAPSGLAALLDEMSEATPVEAAQAEVAAALADVEADAEALIEKLESGAPGLEETLNQLAADSEALAEAAGAELAAEVQELEEQVDKIAVAAAANAAAEAEKAEEEKQAKAEAEKAEKEKERAEKIRVEKERTEKEIAARAEKEKAEKEKAEKEEKEKAEQAALKEKFEQEKAEREKAAQEKAEKEKAEKEKEEQERSAQEKAKQEEAPKDKLPETGLAAMFDKLEPAPAASSGSDDDSKEGLRNLFSTAGTNGEGRKADAPKLDAAAKSAEEPIKSDEKVEPEVAAEVVKEVAASAEEEHELAPPDPVIPGFSLLEAMDRFEVEPAAEVESSAASAAPATPAVAAASAPAPAAPVAPAPSVAAAATAADLIASLASDAATGEAKTEPPALKPVISPAVSADSLVEALAGLQGPAEAPASDAGKEGKESGPEVEAPMGLKALLQDAASAKVKEAQPPAQEPAVPAGAAPAAASVEATPATSATDVTSAAVSTAASEPADAPATPASDEEEDIDSLFGSVKKPAIAEVQADAAAEPAQSEQAESKPVQLEIVAAAESLTPAAPEKAKAAEMAPADKVSVTPAEPAAKPAEAPAAESEASKSASTEKAEPVEALVTAAPKSEAAPAVSESVTPAAPAISVVQAAPVAPAISIPPAPASNVEPIAASAAPGSAPESAAPASSATPAAPPAAAVPPATAGTAAPAAQPPATPATTAPAAQSPAAAAPPSPPQSAPAPTAPAAPPAAPVPTVTPVQPAQPIANGTPGAGGSMLQSQIIAQLEAQVSAQASDEAKATEAEAAAPEGGKSAEAGAGVASEAATEAAPQPENQTQAEVKAALSSALSRLAESYFEQRDFAEAQKLYERILLLRQNQLGEKHQALGQDLTNLAGVLCVQGKFAEAEPYVKRVVEIIENTQPLDMIKLADAMTTLAGVLFQQQKLAECEPLLERSLKLRKEKLGDEHPDIADNLRDYAKLLKKLGRVEEAERYYAQSKAIIAKRGK